MYHHSKRERYKFKKTLSLEPKEQRLLQRKILRLKKLNRKINLK